MGYVLDGVKIADFSWIGATPLATRELAMHGATVIRVECHRVLDNLRVAGPFKNGKPHVDGSATFGQYNNNKYSISLDLNRDGAREVARRLVAWADVVTENMTPGTMAKWGLDYESCRKTKPDLVYLSSCSQGQYGPLAKQHGLGYQAVGTVGFSHITGWPDRGPILLKNAYTDSVAPFLAVVFIVGALAHRRRTGEGVHIDQAQTEAGAFVLGHVYLDCLANRRDQNRNGNRDPYMAPHGIYACSGKEQWVAIAVSGEAEWKSFCEVIGSPKWTRQARFQTLRDRKENEDELDTLVESWALNHTPERVMEMMQVKGVAAAVVRHNKDLFTDPQLIHRKHFHQLPHKVQGMTSYRSPAYKLSESSYKMARASPCLGEDNEYVYRDILGFSDDEISEMYATGVITTEADIPRGKGQE